MNDFQKKVIIITGMLVFGTCTVVTQKILFSMEAIGSSDCKSKFEKPWFQTEAMFVGMAGCLVVYEVMRCLRKNKAKQESENTPLMGGSGSVQAEESTASHWAQYVYVIAPACCDMFATASMNIGLLWIPASVWQMLRGSMVIFSALFSKFFLKRELFAYHWVGVGTVVFALLVVALSALMATEDEKKTESSSSSSSSSSESSSDSSSSDNASSVKVCPKVETTVSSSQEAVGIVLVVGAQIIQASQIVIEEHLLKGISIDPVLIVGLEGLWGGIISSLLLVIVAFLPAPIYEDTIDTFVMMGNNVGILFTVLFYSTVILCYNLFGMLVTNVTTAVIRTILEAVRTACVWIVNLFIYYVISDSFGEKWTDWSYLQLCGFIFLLCGLFLYNGILRVTGLYYPDQQQKIEPEENLA